MLWVILGVFDLTYLARAIWDFVYLNTQLPNFNEMLAAILLGLFWDFMPVMMILIFHYRNFKVQSAAVAQVE